MEAIVIMTLIGLGFMSQNKKEDFKTCTANSKFTKIDYLNKRLPLNHVPDPRDNRQSDKKINEDYDDAVFANLNKEVSDNTAAPAVWHGVSLTGEPIDPSNFTHNNMQPFFGSKVRQNVDEHANQHRLEYQTGNNEHWREKTEVERFFPVYANMTNPYGMSNLDGYQEDRYIVSNKRHFEKPVESIRVGPGLNQGYTSVPSGGLQQSDTLDYIRPKTVDELRIKSNPKLSYEGRVISGMKPAQRALNPEFTQNGPDRCFERGQEHLFTAVGEKCAATSRPNIDLKYTNKANTSLKNRMGPAISNTKSNCLPPKFRKCRKIQYKGHVRNAAAAGMWDILKTSIQKYLPNDYGKGSYVNKTTKKQFAQDNTYKSNCVPAGNKALTTRPNAKMRPSKKLITSNMRKTGNVCRSNQMYVYDRNNKAKTTMKETLLKESEMLNVNGCKRPTNHLLDKLKTTIKDLLADKTDPIRNVATTKKFTVHNKERLRTTVKESTLKEAARSNLSAPCRTNYTRDKDAATKTTVKQTTIDMKRNGNIGGKSCESTYTKPRDKPRTTVKETTIAEGKVGGVNLGHSDGYRIAKHKAKNTIKQNILSSYFGNAEKPDGCVDGAYKVRKMDAPNTNKQFTSNNEHFGNADSRSKKTMSYEAIYNATVKETKSIGIHNRAPTNCGKTKGASKDNITMEVTKKTEQNNAAICERGLNVGQSVVAIPCADTMRMGETTIKSGSENTRFDTSVMSQLNKNPYAIDIAA